MSILDGATFVVCDRRGDLDAETTETHGLFHDDMRHLSRFVLTLDGLAPTLLSIDDSAHYATQFFLVHPTGSVLDDAHFSVIRRRWINRGFQEEITVLSHCPDRVDLDLRIEIGADFADLFEVKEHLAKAGAGYERVTDEGLLLGYRRGTYLRETLITVDDPTCVFSPGGLHLAVSLPPAGRWSTTIHASVADVLGDIRPLPRTATSFDAAVTDHASHVDKWRQTFPTVTSDWSPLVSTYQQGIADLAALRLPASSGPEAVLPAAGLPWFMCLFGRDSIITSYQALPFAPEFAEATLRTLALMQARTVDDFRDAQPGKIMHEARGGELTAFEERPHSPYFGSVDATPLFLILLDEYERWTGDEALVHQLQRQARAALAWLDDQSERGGGYVRYERRNTKDGLENQCWKDSPNSILFADGSNSRPPRATCEVQGYVYDAKRRMARVARTFWGDASLADRLDRDAAELRERFNRDFWIAGREHFALALDGDDRQVDSLTSNVGHLLWSGIADDDKADACRRHLLGPRLHSGWGVRTMAEGEGGYNPVGYHNGTVWPHDNSLIAAGLARYGYRNDAAQLALGMLQASAHLRHRLPEAFAGYPRGLTAFPVEYPTACSPQAWAAGATFLFIRSLLGLEVDGRRLRADPALPAEIGFLDVVGLRGRWGRADVRSREATSASVDSGQATTLRQVLAEVATNADTTEVRQLGGSIRIDTADGPSWHVRVCDGRLQVSPSRHEADCVVSGSEEVLMRLYSGETTPLIAAMQGLVQVAGDSVVALRYGELIAAAGRAARSSD